MEINGKDVYLIAVKALFRSGNKILLTHDIWDQWDLPGGRIKKDEFEKPLESVLERKLKEELGSSIKYKIGEPKTFFRVKRIEHLETGGEMTVKIFGIGYEVEYLGGKIILGSHHDNMKWFSIEELNPEEYLKGGWENGLNDYLKIAKRG